MTSCLKKQNHFIQLLLNDDQFFEASIDNSSITIRSNGIAQVVNMGKGNTTNLLDIMNQTNDFNIFCRCFCALQQLHQKKFLWYGGADVKEMNGKNVILRGGQEDLEDFKSEVLQSIKRAL